jgi:crotonobetainyl-CoA:carnitine CoA-transferase CaiB-like acyl-CoA transferase
VITVRDDDDWRRLGRALGAPAWAAQERLASAAGRVADREEIDARLAEWTRELPARQVAEVLQRAGVPAGFMQRPDEYDRDPQFRAREFLRTFEQPGLEPLRIEYGPLRSEEIPLPPDAPAPELGGHTREICSTLLGMQDEEIERLLATGVLQAPASAPQTAELTSSPR